MNNYPHTAGYAHGRETSQAAAESVDADTLREEARLIFESGWTGTDWQLMKEIGRDYETVQPRRSELTQNGLVDDTGKRSNESRSGKLVAVWGLITHTNRRESGQNAPKGILGSLAAMPKPPHQAGLKSQIISNHDSWMPKGGVEVVKDLSYWQAKAEGYARALGRISVAADAGANTRDIAKKALAQ